jgi:hypothetical protein
MKIKTIITILLVIIFIITVSGYILYQNNVSEIQKITSEYFKDGDKRRGGFVIQNSLKNNNRSEFVITKFDIQKPVTTTVLLVQKLENNKLDIIFDTTYLERTGLNRFKATESIISSSSEYSFEEALEVAKKYDVYKNNPDPSKIINYPEINRNPSQIEEAQKRQIRTEQQTNEYKILETGKAQEKTDFICKNEITRVQNIINTGKLADGTPVSQSEIQDSGQKALTFFTKYCDLATKALPNDLPQVDIDNLRKEVYGNDIIK